MLLLAGLIGLIAYDWDSLDNGERLAFLGLAGLGVVIVGRVDLARRTAHSGAGGWRERYIGHIYFTYVSLWIGFLIVPAINSPFPILAVVLAVGGVLVVGGTLLSRYKRRVLAG